MMMMMLGFERESAAVLVLVCCKRYGDSACGRDGEREGVSILATRAPARPRMTNPHHQLTLPTPFHHTALYYQHHHHHPRRRPALFYCCRRVGHRTRR